MFIVNLFFNGEAICTLNITFEYSIITLYTYL